MTSRRPVLAAAADGSCIAFTAGKDREEVWVMENFLPPAGSSRASK